MKSHADQYESFLLNGTIDQYRAAQVEPYQVEIEHLSMQACIDAIIKPAGIAVDILYLDRSEGHTVNTVHLPADLSPGQMAAPTLRLLYRP